MVKDSDYENSGEKLLSEYNEAKFQIIRLHNLWVNCNNYRRTAQLQHLAWELDTIWDEISSKAMLHDKKLSEKVVVIDKKISSIKDDDRIDNFDGVFYYLLRQKYRLLKWIQEVIGMGGKMKEDKKELMDDF